MWVDGDSMNEAAQAQALRQLVDELETDEVSMEQIMAHVRAISPMEPQETLVQATHEALVTAGTVTMED